MITIYFTRTEHAVKQHDLHDAADLVDKLTTDLADYQPSVGFSDRGWLSIRLTLPAVSADAAARAAALTARDAAHRAGIVDGLEEILALEVYTEPEFEAREGFTPEERYNVADAMAYLGVSRQAILQQIESGSLAGARKEGDTYTIPVEAVRARARARVVLGWTTNDIEIDNAEHRRAILEPMYEDLSIIGALPAYQEAQKAERGEPHNETYAQIWRDAEQDAIHAMDMLGISTEGVRFFAEPLNRRGTTGF